MRHSISCSQVLCAGLGCLITSGQLYALPIDCGQRVNPVFAIRPGSPVSPRGATDPELLNLNPPSGTFAASSALDNRGLIDGVYACDVTLNGATERTLISFNGKSNGQTIYAVASMKTHYVAGATKPPTPISQPFRGYGIGSISAAGYTGTTWNGQPFSFTLLGLDESTSQHTYDVLRIAGTVGIDANQAAQLVCKTDRALF